MQNSQAEQEVEDTDLIWSHFRAQNSAQEDPNIIMLKTVLSSARGEFNTVYSPKANKNQKSNLTTKMIKETDRHYQSD